MKESALAWKGVRLFQDLSRIYVLRRRRVLRLFPERPQMIFACCCLRTGGGD
ncbi:hypothetical protein B005_4928 [Nocardiopsis alba ATCC BAA-2165]|uniref:Uncharacterized protein n=1 Tax=Nocardiopsis alba (strain ATCC BAA-2165 / BE74) TaxID=1205910 RepID=J7L5W3_NOCAA|nr:hypothetical protein B005_4928 [Nocardiopsis alba ATCC BAA-2165]